jgi:hypothetical protein
VKTMRKDPGGAKSRGEWEWPITSNKSDISRFAETPVGSALTATDLAALQPIFTITVCRTTRQVQLEDGTLAEVVFDQGEILADSAREPISELEMELKAGSLGPLYRLALDLAMAAPLTIEPASKAERGFRLHTGERPHASKASAVSVSADTSAAQAFQQIVLGYTVRPPDASTRSCGALASCSARQGTGMCLRWKLRRPRRRTCRFRAGWIYCARLRRQSAPQRTAPCRTSCAEPHSPGWYSV